MSDPRCVVCGGAYGTRFMCTPCKSDPANDGWREADEAESSWHAPPEDRGVVELEGEAPTERVWNPTDKQRAIIRLAVAGGTVASISRATGSPVQYVRRVLKEFGVKGISLTASSGGGTRKRA